MAMALTQSELFTFKIDCQAHNSFKILEHMQKERMFCDVTLVAKDMEISAHKNVLASCSPYFYSMFTNLQTVDQQRIELDINPQMLHSIVNYMYTSKITVMGQDIMDLLEVSKMLLLYDVQVECGNVLKSILHSSNCIDIKRVAAKCEDSNLMKSALSFIDDNFIEVIASEEFLNLTSDEMTELISKDTLKVCSEEKVYEGIVRWIKHNPKERRKYLRLLMGYVRFRFIPKDYLNQHIIEDSFLKGDAYCRELLIKVLVEEYITNIPKPKPRLYETKVLLVLGGDEDKACNSLEYYDFSKKCWSNTLEIPFTICNVSLVTACQKIYLVGGYRNGRASRIVNYYNINTNSWHESNNMIKIRKRHGIGISNNCIYAVGGSNDRDILNSVEKFDFQMQKWSLITPMLHNRSLLGVATLNDILYVVGGEDENDSTLNSVECYDHHTNTWKELNSMNSCRSVAGVCAFDGKLYAIGGYDGERFLSSMEVYSPDTDTWTIIRPMHVPRGYHSVAVLNNKIYVTGGYDGAGDLNCTEVYDTITNSWTNLPEAMNVARSCHAAVIVNKHT